MVGAPAPRDTQRRTNPAAGDGKCAGDILMGSDYLESTQQLERVLAGVLKRSKCRNFTG